MERTEVKSPQELQREYLRAWRQRNPEKVKKYNRTYWERKARKKEVVEIAENKADGEV